MLKMNDIKKILENAGIKFKETDNSIIIFKEDTEEDKIAEILKSFGIDNTQIEIVDEGTIVKSKSNSSQRLKMILSPFYPLEKMEIIDANNLLLKDLYLNIPTNEEGIDDLGDTGVSPLGVVELAEILDKEFPNIEIVLVDDDEIELPVTDDLIEFLNNIEDKLSNLDVIITDDKIIIKRIDDAN